MSVDDMHVPLTEPDAEVRVPRVTSVEIRAAFEFLDTVDLKATFSRRACVMKTTPHFLRGPFRNALRLAMEEAVDAGEVHRTGHLEVARCTGRSWWRDSTISLEVRGVSCLRSL